MRNIVEGDHSRLEFDSVADLLTTVQAHRYATNLGLIESMPEFFGGDVRSIEHLFELARLGWEEQLDATLNVAADALATVQRSYDVPDWQSHYDVQGSDVDVARFLSGEPENMVSHHLVPTPRMGRVISLAVNIGASYDISAMDMIERGKSIVALVYALERIGIRTEVFTDSQSKGSKGTSETIRQVVKVKDAADALDPAMIMFTLAHPAFYRGLVMASKHEHPRRFHKPLKIGNTYGYPIDRLSNEVFPNECIILKTVMRSDDRNVSDVEAFVVSHLKDLGLI